LLASDLVGATPTQQLGSDLQLLKEPCCIDEVNMMKKGEGYVT
jgi:hypothetical protein